MYLLDSYSNHSPNGRQCVQVGQIYFILVRLEDKCGDRTYEDKKNIKAQLYVLNPKATER